MGKQSVVVQGSFLKVPRLHPFLRVAKRKA